VGFREHGASIPRGLPHVPKPRRQSEAIGIHIGSNGVCESFRLSTLHPQRPITIVELFNELLIGTFGDAYGADNTVPLHDHAARSISLAT
jgi:hypothetical protein